MNNTADVIIIGSGIVGGSAAYYMAKKGLKVLVLEKDMIGHGASSRNGAGVRISGRVDSEFGIARVAIREIWPTLSEELEVDTEYEKPGSFLMAVKEEQMAALHRSCERALKQEIEAEVIDGDELRRRCPYISEKVVGAVWYPEDGFANPMKTTLGYYKQGRKLGVRYVTGEEAVEIRKCRGRARQVVTAAGNIYEADKIIVAAGFESRALMKTVGIHLPFLERIDECLITEPQPPMFRYRLSSADGNFYGHQTQHGSFIFGGNTNMERYEDTYAGQPRNTASSVSDKARNAALFVPALRGAKIVRYWAGWLDSTIDRLPVIQEIPEVPGLISACGFSGHGFALGPGMGRLLTEMVTGEPLCADISAFQYDRFHAEGCFGPRTNYPKV